MILPNPEAFAYSDFIYYLISDVTSFMYEVGYLIFSSMGFQVEAEYFGLVALLFAVLVYGAVGVFSCWIVFKLFAWLFSLFVR